MAGRCLGELVRKMGERVLTHIIPILQKGMSSEDAATRQASAQDPLAIIMGWCLLSERQASQAAFWITNLRGVPLPCRGCAMG